MIVFKAKVRVGICKKRSYGTLEGQGMDGKSAGTPLDATAQFPALTPP